MRIGTAGWSIPRDASSSFPGEGTHLARYAGELSCAEINSSFHRRHRVEIYRRWADQVPSNFRFSVKLPRTITHDLRLLDAHEPLADFLSEVEGLGDRLAVLLVQLPPSLAFNHSTVVHFFGLLTDLYAGAVVCEPRHESWFTPSANQALADLRVGRVGADPARWPEAFRPGGWRGEDGDGCGAVLYHRWHGAPRTYWSRYEQPWLEARSEELSLFPASADCWSVFDNTAGGGATANALGLRDLLAAKVRATTA